MHSRHACRALVAGAVVLATAVTTLGTGAGATAPPGGETRTVDTYYGPIEVPAEPVSIVAVSYDTPWQLAGIGVEPIGVQDFSAWQDQFTPDEWAVVDGVDTIGSFDSLNYEAIAALDPDLIVGDAYEIDEATFDLLNDIAPTAIAGGTERGDWRAIVDSYGEFTGATDAVDATREAFDATLDRLTTTYADEIGSTRWAYITIGDSDGQFSLLYPSSTWGELLYDALGASLPDGVEDTSPPGGYESYSFEQAGTYLGGADVVLHPVAGAGTMYPWMDAILASPVVAAVPAIAEGRVFGITTSVNDYVSAEAWLNEVETTVLETLAG